MLIKEKAQNVLRKLVIAQEEENIELKEKNFSKYAEYTHRYYFFTILKNPDGTEGIDFNNLEESLKRAEPQFKKNIVRKLQSGLVAKNGDNFKWDSIAIKTNKYNGETHKEYIVYYGKLTPDGRRTNNERIIPEDISKTVNIENFIKEHNVYVNKEGIPDAIYLSPDQGTFIEKEASDQDMRFILKTQGTYQGGENWDQFKSEYFSNYRVWFAERKELRKPDLSVPVDDDFLKEGQPYRGRPQDLEALLKATNINLDKLEETESPESLGDQMKKQENKKEEKKDFSPVDEQGQRSKDDVTNKYKDASSKDSKIKEIKEDEPGVNYYVGDFSILQDLVKRQHKKMKVRKQAGMTPTPVTPGTQTTSPANKVEIDLNNPPDHLKNKAKAVSDFAEKKQDLLDDAQRKTEQLNRDINRMTRASAQKVIENYFK